MLELEWIVSFISTLIAIILEYLLNLSRKRTYFPFFRCQSASRAGEPTACGDLRGWDITSLLQSRGQSQSHPELEEERWYTPHTGQISIPCPWLFHWPCIGMICGCSLITTGVFWFDGFLSPPSVCLFCCSISMSVQAISPHGFHQIKSNSLDALHRRIEEQQVCPSSHCLSHTTPSRSHPSH